MTAQYTRYLATLVCRPTPVPASPRGASTWTNFLCGIEHFRTTTDAPAKCLRLDRGALWRLCYPVALSFFCLFVCVPGYDATCTCTLCAGLFVRAVHEEFTRGAWFHRPISRRLLLTVLCLFGALSIVLLFALGYTTGLIVTNRGLESSRQLVDREDATLLDALVDAGNSSSAFDDAGIIDNFIYDAEISNPDVVQYLQWTVHSYPRKMSAVWFLFFLAPFMLANVPESAPTARARGDAHVDDEHRRGQPVLYLDRARAPAVCAAAVQQLRERRVHAALAGAHVAHHQEAHPVPAPARAVHPALRARAGHLCEALHPAQGARRRAFFQ